MPLHFNDRDLAAETQGVRSALIIPCYLCPAVTVAVRENKPFIQLLSHFLTSPPFADYLNKLQADLNARGIKTQLFKSRLLHHWFLCMWTEARRRKLKKVLQNYDSLIVLGCESATATVLDLVEDTSCRVIEGLEVTGFMNAKLTFRRPCNVSFEESRIIPISPQSRKGPGWLSRLDKSERRVFHG